MESLLGAASFDEYENEINSLPNLENEVNFLEDFGELLNKYPKIDYSYYCRQNDDFWGDEDMLLIDLDQDNLRVSVPLTDEEKNNLRTDIAEFKEFHILKDSVSFINVDLVDEKKQQLRNTYQIVKINKYEMCLEYIALMRNNNKTDLENIYMNILKTPCENYLLSKGLSFVII
jgi:hypothetical protein